jgi:hypothetical protein
MTGKKKDQCSINPERQWGGKREGGGFPAKWKHGNSKPIRIPEALHEAVLAYAHALDEGQPPGSEPGATYESMAQPTVEDIKALMLTLEAIDRTLERWRQELKKHDAKLARWEKAHQLFTQLEADLRTPLQSG